MHNVLWTIGGNTAIAIVIVFLAFATQWMNRPAVAHLLWLCVMLKLITPPMLRLPIHLPASPPPHHAIIAEQAAENDVPVVTERSAFAQPTSSVSRNEPEGRFEFSLDIAAVVVWSAGSVVLATIYVVRLRALRRLLHASDRPPAEILRHVQAIARQMRLRRIPKVCMTRAPLSPMVVGFARSCVLVLPTELMVRLTPRARESVIVHELAHLCRGDHFVRWFEALATIALWWHPLMWLSRRQLRIAEEQCCDAWVLATLSDARRDYANALVDAIGFLSGARTLPLGASGLGQFRHLRRRLIMIMKHPPRARLSRWGKVIVAMALLALPLVPAVAEQSSDAKDQEIKQLRARVEQLEERLANAEKQMAASTLPATSLANPPHDFSMDEMFILQEVAKDPDRIYRGPRENYGSLWHYYLGKYYFEHGQHDKAKEVWDYVLKNHPDDGDGRGHTLGELIKTARSGEFKMPQPQRAALQQKARVRARLDAKKYKPEQLDECEQLYQTANENWRSPEAILTLKKMIEKFPDVNRTGCAVLYLGQMSKGDDREKYLKDAVDKYSDCFYFDGVQVGGYARYLLADYYRETNRPDEAMKLLDELVAKYPDAITHDGQSLSQIVKQERRSATTRSAK